MELVTPPDDGCILNGLTRQSIVDLKDRIHEEMNIKVVEREMSIHEMVAASREDRLLEMFGVSTHCPLMPINRVVYRDTTMLLNSITQGKYS